MKWLEAVFGWSPDDGSGSFELLIGLLVIAFCAARWRANGERRRALAASVDT